MDLAVFPVAGSLGRQLVITSLTHIICDLRSHFDYPVMSAAVVRVFVHLSTGHGTASICANLFHELRCAL